MVDDIYNRAWIIDNAKEVLEEYPEGLTLRQLHYRLVARGMINDYNHYKRLGTAMGVCRWNGEIPFDVFIDRERSVFGSTSYEETSVEDEIEYVKGSIEYWMDHYSLNRWSNQDTYLEVWIEKKALQGVFERPCSRNSVGLFPCKGYPSITALYEASKRFMDANEVGKTLVILYFGDYDPSGVDIPRSIQENLNRLGVDVQVIRIALHPEQIRALNLSGVPAKSSDTRSVNWNGDDVVELDAIDPKVLSKMCNDEINKYFDRTLYDELKQRESEEKEIYKQALKDFVNELADKED